VVKAPAHAVLLLQGRPGLLVAEHLGPEHLHGHAALPVPALGLPEDRGGGINLARTILSKTRFQYLSISVL
jgi:hypothetical protein